MEVLHVHIRLPTTGSDSVLVSVSWDAKLVPVGRETMSSVTELAGALNLIFGQVVARQLFATAGVPWPSSSAGDTADIPRTVTYPTD